MNDDPSSDLLHGLKAIADHLGMTDRQVQHLHETAQLPTFNLGRRVCARKSALARHFAEQENSSRNVTRSE